MGTSNHVKDIEHRRYEQTYQFYNEKGINRLLKDFHNLKIRAYDRGDMAAIDIRLDLEKAIELAQLTDRQKEVLDLIFNRDMKIEDVAALLGVDSSTVSRTKKAGLTRIARVYRDWKYIE